jgi:hypothetical protein
MLACVGVATVQGRASPRSSCRRARSEPAVTRTSTVPGGPARARVGAALQLVVVDMLVGLRVCPVVGMGSFRRDHHFIEIRFFAAFCHGSAVPAYDGRQPSRSGATRGVGRQCLLEHRALAGQNAFETFAVSAMPSKPGGADDFEDGAAAAAGATRTRPHPADISILREHVAVRDRGAPRCPKCTCHACSPRRSQPCASRSSDPLLVGGLFTERGDSHRQLRALSSAASWAGDTVVLHWFF